MSERTKAEVTRLLRALRPANPDADRAREQLYAVTYPELQRVAMALLSHERPGHTLEPSALVHEVYLKLVAQDGIDWKDRVHFFGVATRAMRQILVDHARRRNAEKRGGDWRRVTLTDLPVAQSDNSLQLIELDQVLQRLATLDERMARVVELRVFGGLTHEEIAELLGFSVRTCADDWAFARRWLAREMASEG